MILIFILFYLFIFYFLKGEIDVSFTSEVPRNLETLDQIASESN